MSGYTGQCLCGEIKYQVDEIGSKMAHCHCSMCRRFHGAAFATFGEVKVEHFHWLQGEENLAVYQAPNKTKRKFCAHCGSSLIFEPSGDNHEVVEFSLATLDPSPGAMPRLIPDAHIYTSTQVEWLELDDQLPKFSLGRE